MLQGKINRVVERGAASRINALQDITKVVMVLRKILVDINLVVEVNQEDLVLGIGGSHEGHGGFVYAFPLGSHASAIINHHSHRNRHVFFSEERDLLLDLVFIDCKFLFLETLDDFSLFVLNRHVKQDQ